MQYYEVLALNTLQQSNKQNKIIIKGDYCLPGIMLEPGSFSGSSSSPSPQRGPEPRKRMSLAIFMRLQATTLRAP